jgi:hypothetical protein
LSGLRLAKSPLEAKFLHHLIFQVTLDKVLADCRKT